MAKVNATYGPFKTTWQTGDPYMDVVFNGADVHAISTAGDLDDDGMPKDGRSAQQYVKDELRAFVKEDGGAYVEAYTPRSAPVQRATQGDVAALRAFFGNEPDKNADE